MAAIKALQQWCKIQCDGYRDVSIVNMTTSFRDGLAFCALIHKFRPDLISFDSLSKDDVYNNNHLAFCVAEDHLGIPALLDAEDMVALPIPDRLSILTYVSQYYNYFNGRAPMGGVGGVKRPAEGSKEEPSEKKNLPVFAQTYSRKVLPESYPRSSSAASKSAENCPPSLSIQNSSYHTRHVSPSLKQQPGMEERPPSTNIQKQSPSSVSPSRVKSSDMDTEKKSVLLESSNKTGTLNSKCAVCRNHVHLVQRHLVDGKLYHRSCFKCGVCSAVLQTGKYKAGLQPGTLLCLSHCTQNALKSSAKTSGLDPMEIRLKPESGSGPSPVQRDSASINPLNVVLKSVETSLAPQPWTASALRTQVARQRFFLSACEVPTTQNTVVPKSEEGAEQPRLLSPTKLAESNCNNNNKVYSCGLNTDNKMWTPTSSDKATSWKQKRHGSAATEEEPRHLSPSPPSTTRTSDVGSPWLSAINKERTRPPSSPLFITRAKDTAGCEAQVDWKSKLNRVPNGTGLIPLTENKALTPEKNKISRTDELNRPYAPSALDLQASKTAECVYHKSTAVDQPRHVSNASGENGNVSFGNGSPVNKSPTIRSCWIPMEQITEELQEIDNSLSNLEKEGIDLERRLRKCEEEGSGDILADPLMVEWFNLIRKKQSYIRRESELMHILKTQDLEEEQPGVEGELRRLINKSEHLKSASERKREADLMKRLVEIVNDRNAIVEGLEEDRLREEEEDQQLNEMMQRLGLQKLKSRRKSSFSKLFRRRSKKGLVEQ